MRKLSHIVTFPWHGNLRGTRLTALEAIPRMDAVDAVSILPQMPWVLLLMAMASLSPETCPQPVGATSPRRCLEVPSPQPS